jgi:hypothetical protein
MKGYILAPSVVNVDIFKLVLILTSVSSLSQEI